jgi:hypothetical protein
MKTKKVIDAAGNEHTILIPENDFDQQIAMGYSVGGIGDADKSARRKRGRKTQQRKNDKTRKVK